jgi:hypothetical protein
VGGVLLNLLVCLGWVYGRISGKDGRISHVIPILRWQMDPKLILGMISGAGTWLLRQLFQFYLVFARVNDAAVVDHLEFLGGSNQWNERFDRAAQNWDVDIFASFFQVLHSTKVKKRSEDKLWWIPSKRDCLRQNPFIAPWLVLKGVAFLGRVCGKLKFL